MGTYVISDLHGDYDSFMKMLKTIKYTKKDKLYILGDIIDRGPDSIKLLKYIMKMEGNTVVLKGNHESMLVEYHNSILKGLLRGNGNTKTVEVFDKLPHKEKIEIVEYINNLKLYEIVETQDYKYILVHAGLNLSGNKEGITVEEELASQQEEDMLWIREDFYKKKGIEGYTIIFGHTPTAVIRDVEPYNFDIWVDNKYKDKICIDCGAVFRSRGGIMCCLRLEDQKIYYV